MRLQLIKDASGNPVFVALEYRDWQMISTALKKKDNNAVSGLDLFDLTERVSHILNTLMAHYFTEGFKEEEKEEPDREKIELYDSKFDELRAVYYDPATFEDLETMKAVIAKYSPVLKEIYASI